MNTQLKANETQVGGKHYKGGKFQHWDLIARNRIGYLEGCSSKYASRWNVKYEDPELQLEDLEKGVHYCDKIMEMIEDEGYSPSGCAPYSDLQLFFSENQISDPDAQMAIAHLCTWDSIASMQLAKKHMLALLEKAKALAV
jgi:hypothetical protein